MKKNLEQLSGLSHGSRKKSEQLPSLGLSNQDTLQSTSAQGSHSSDAPIPIGQDSITTMTSAPMQAKKAKPEDAVNFQKSGDPIANRSRDWFTRTKDGDERSANHAPERADLFQKMKQGMTGDTYGDALNGTISNASGSVNIAGLSLARMTRNLQGEMGTGMSSDDVLSMYQKLGAGGGSNKGSVRQFSDEEIANMDTGFDQGMTQLKGLQYTQLKRLRDTYGTYGSQMHPQDFINRLGPEFFDQTSMLQDTEQMMRDGGKYFDMENNADDQEFKALSDYFNDMVGSVNLYSSTGLMGPDVMPSMLMDSIPETARAVGAEGTINGPGMNQKDHAGYLKRVKNKFKKSRGNLFGRFK